MTESKVCLVEGKIWWIENNGEKIEEKMSVCCLVRRDRERKFLSGVRHFPPRPTQNLPLWNGEKTGMKMPVKEEKQK